MRLRRLFRRDRCAVCHLPARLGHHNATHDAHQATQDGSPVPVDGKPAPVPQNGSCVVCVLNLSHTVASRRQWSDHTQHTLEDAMAQYRRDERALEAHQRKVDAFAAALKEETA